MKKILKHGAIMSGTVFVIGGSLILLASKFGIGVFAVLLLAFVAFLGL